MVSWRQRQRGQGQRVRGAETHVERRDAGRQRRPRPSAPGRDSHGAAGGARKNGMENTVGETGRLQQCERPPNRGGVGGRDHRVL